jgi:serine/threonine protein phosphatase PrpC
MGCGSTKIASKDATVPELRRRLSLGEVGPGECIESSAGVSNEDRSMLMELTQSQIMNFIKADDMAGRKYSIGSETDATGKLARSFSDKSVMLYGSEFDPIRDCVGFACKKGLKPEAPNQDSFFILKIEDNYSIYGVFDGHGKSGHDVSNFIKDNLPKILLSQESLPEDPVLALTKTFEKTQYLIEKATLLKKIDASRSGSTCSVVLHSHRQNTIYMAHVGDSRVVMGQMSSSRGMAEEDQTWTALDLTVDHKPDLPEERARIEKAGGVVLFDGGWNYRVYAKGKRDHRGKRYPGLNMSRAMGDLSGFYDAGISASPEVKTHSMNTISVAPAENGNTGGDKTSDDEEAVPVTRAASGGSSVASVSSHELDPNVDKFLLLCSDGVWEFISSKEAVKAVATFAPSEAKKAAEHLASMAWDRWMRELDGQVVDDITALVIHLR